MTENNIPIHTYHNLCFDISKQVTKAYSTSFYTATQLFDADIRSAIHSIYGFVRFADEIVDSFHAFPQKSILERFEQDYYFAAEQGISANPILHSFQLTVKQYGIPDEYIQAFLNSMRADLEKKAYKTKLESNQYIYGSADVVGLVCLKVFCGNNTSLFQSLREPAMRLGSAFQKVNFLRDLKYDVFLLGRTYFPDFSIENFDDRAKDRLVKEIEADFKASYAGIRQLPDNSRLAVTVAYKYYLGLLEKIRQTPASRLLSKRIRVSDFHKFALLSGAVIKNTFHLK